jgi:hypothetical protein
MKETFAVLNQMVKDGALENYAVGGAVGAMFYVESFATQDIDVFVLASENQIILELPGLDYLKALGYTEFQNEGIVIEGWPVQFLPASTALEKEAYLNAGTLDFEEVPVRVSLPEHLVAIMLKVGRPKDLARIEMFLSQNAIKFDALEDVIRRHGLVDNWNRFSEKFGYERKL